MLHDEVKRLADSGDVVGLRYVFVDALDADPTFGFYQEDYDYCRSKGLLEPHQELTPLTQDETQWTKEYWVHLKTDLRKNLSEKRLMHMKQVAQVLKADEIRRITEERRQAAEAARLQEERKQKEAERPASSATQTPSQAKTGTAAEEERRRIEALKAKYAREEAERKRRTEVARIETDKANAEERRKPASKKVIRVAVAAAILVVMIAIILVVVSNPGNAAAALRAGAAFGKAANTAISF